MSVELLVAGAREPVRRPRRTRRARPTRRFAPPTAIVALCLALLGLVLVVAGSFALRPQAAVPGVGSYDPGPQYQPLLGRPLR
ncbi:hypothetical protein [Jatrophihabitans fulvus]